MANTKKSDFVTFEDSSGNTISNDPNYLALERLKAAGISTEGGARTPADHDEELTTPYDHLKQTELKDLAKKHGVDIKGVKTLGELRGRLDDADLDLSESDEEDEEETDEDAAQDAEDAKDQ